MSEDVQDYKLLSEEDLVDMHRTLRKEFREAQYSMAHASYRSDKNELRKVLGVTASALLEADNALRALRESEKPRVRKLVKVAGKKGTTP
ncbi:MAG: hypothetical protein OXT65_04280 [Alphaproteobacteria bacterium]|nr:hypothetical protein [Alphaproteobacteria bacterium]